MGVIVDSKRQADELRERMAQLRQDLVGDIDQVSESARAMADWRYYVRRFPVATTAVVAAVGYLIVPRRGGTQTEFNAAGDGKPMVKAGGLVGSIVSIAGAAALRMATAYMTEKVKSSLRGRPYGELEEDYQSGDDVPLTPRPR